MSPTKLTESDKQEIVRLYRDLQETTTTLAKRFRVSNSTIGRLLKGAFSPEEYDALVRQKRSNRMTAAARIAAAADETDDREPVEQVAAEATPTELTGAPAAPEAADDCDDDADLEVVATAVPAAAADSWESPDDGEEDAAVAGLDEGGTTPPEPAMAADEGQSWLDGIPVAGGDEGDDDYTVPASSIWSEDCESLEEDDWDEDEGDEGDDRLSDGHPTERDEEIVEILPLSAASFPRTCYLVVDRSGELIVKPLVEFRDLGRLPDAEFQEKTLVVFDNHKVARRYSNNRTQRVVKIPDGRLLYKTSLHLHRKGITRILMDGRVYALADRETALQDS